MSKQIITNKDEIEALGFDDDLSLNMFAQVRKSLQPRARRRKSLSRMKGKGKPRRYKSDIKGSNTGRYMLGYASTIDKDRAKDVIVIDAIEAAAKDLLQPGANTVFYNHDTNKAIGRVMETAVDSKGLLVKLMISKADDVANIWTKIKEGVLNAFSIRLRPKKIEVVRDEETHQVLEYRILSMELFEVSVVGLPCNAKCSVTDVIEKSFSGKTRNTKGKKTMKDKDTKKKSADSGVSEDRVKELIGEAVNPLAESLKAMADAQKSANSVLEKLADGTDDKNKGQEDDATADSNTALVDAVKSLTETVKDLKEGGKRKGFEGTDEDDDDSDDNGGIPKKCLKDATDPDTLKYVIHVANHSKEYDALSDEEKTQVKGIYIQAVNASQAA